MNTTQLIPDYERDGVVRIRRLFTPDQVAAIRAELDRYIREDLDSKPADARTLEADGKTVRNLWRLEQHHPALIPMVARPDIVALVSRLVHGEPVLCGVETFNKPARIGSGVPYHQDNAYFCQTPPDMLTIWIAMDPATLENGPVYYVRGSHHQGMLPTKPSGVKGNSIGMAEPSTVPLSDQFCGLLAPGDALIHQCETIHHSAPNTSDHPRLGLLLVYRGKHTQTDPKLKAAYTAALSATPPA
ncbi:phytanoyl-CoA dioxygenase family protein [Prosthecobacter sp.]|jgi:phytanoyl-CoA hydroxylase|uniref:phytanoyl-CoA dioxygenase family protein n=1 Tax=Prosthecobacter sp. TaxID=1965333 RepID=UPI0037838355